MTGVLKTMRFAVLLCATGAATCTPGRETPPASVAPHPTPAPVAAERLEAAPTNPIEASPVAQSSRPEETVDYFTLIDGQPRLLMGGHSAYEWSEDGVQARPDLLAGIAGREMEKPGYQERWGYMGRYPDALYVQRKQYVGGGDYGHTQWKPTTWPEATIAADQGLPELPCPAYGVRLRDQNLVASRKTILPLGDLLDRTTLAGNHSQDKRWLLLTADATHASTIANKLGLPFDATSDCIRERLGTYISPTWK